MPPRLPQLANWLRHLPFHRSIRYSRLPLYEGKDGKELSLTFRNINLKGMRWRSPSPGGDKFTITLRMSLLRLISIVIITIICFVLMIVATVKHNKPPPPVIQVDTYPWQDFPKYVQLMT